MEGMVEVGRMALRSPCGKFLPSVPIYEPEEKVGGKSKTSGLSVGEEKVLNNLADVFADIFKYQQGRDAALRAGQ
jgi:hypothetical protein